MSGAAPSVEQCRMLTADEVTFAYTPGTPVLRSVSAALPPGSITAIMGPNGAGKTTLMRLLLGLLAPSEGAIRLGDDLVSDLSPARRASRLAYVPQSVGLAFGFTVRALLGFGCVRASREARDKAVAKVLDQLDLKGRAEEAFASLSAGQQQRVLLGRAIAQLEATRRQDGPRAIIADEPASAMDPRHAREAMAILRSVAERGDIVGVVLHDFPLASRHADRLVLLDAEGRVAASGPFEEASEPGTLARVFGVPFERASLEDGARVLVPGGSGADTIGTA